MTGVALERDDGERRVEIRDGEVRRRTDWRVR